MNSRRADNTEATRAAILAAARRLFGESGYDGAGLSEISHEARVTTGAIYHHFEGKRGLFQAVAEQIEAELLEAARAAATENSWTSLTAAFDQLIDACAKREVQQIIFRDGERVLGAEAWREIEKRYAYGALETVLGELKQAGLIRDYPVSLVTPVLLSVLIRASQAVAADASARPAARDLLRRVLELLHP